MLPLTFRGRLVLALMAVVTGGTAASLFLTQRNVEAAYRRIFAEQFESEVRFVSELQQARLGAVKQKCLELAKSVRLLAALEEDDDELLQQIALDELREVLRPDNPRHATFFRFVDATGSLRPSSDARTGRTGTTNRNRAAREERISRVGREALAAEVAELVGYLAGDGPAAGLEEVIVTRIVDPVGRRRLGALVMGFPAPDLDAIAGAQSERIHTGIWLEGRLHAPALERRHPEATRLLERTIAGSDAPDGSLDLELDGPARAFYRRLSVAPGFPRAVQVTLFSLADSIGEQRALRRRILTSGGVALLAALALSVAISRGLSVPIDELVRATAEVQGGNFDVRVGVRRPDELGRLAGSFNAMTEELAAKQRLRSLLDQVADRNVAEELIRGRISRGGEVRDVSVVFADIRGFTALAETMEPAAIVALLNEHMSALTAVVHDHQGLVDKFVGDSLMAIFGAPLRTGDDAWRAVRCAWKMLEARRRLNSRSEAAVEIGIGIASGEAVAGCMGSEDRLSYTVLGSRVNLAARLCASAGGGELWIDEITYARVRERLAVEPVAHLALKGFRAPVAAYRVTRIAPLEA